MNCGLQLWRKLTQEYAPKWKSRQKNCIRRNHVLEYMEMLHEEDPIRYGVQFSKPIEKGRETLMARLGALNIIEVEPPVPRAGGTAAEIGSVTEGRIPISVSNDSGAEITFGRELAPAIPTKESEENLSGVKFFVPRVRHSSTTDVGVMSSRSVECSESCRHT